MSPPTSSRDGDVYPEGGREEPGSHRGRREARRFEADKRLAEDARTPVEQRIRVQALIERYGARAAGFVLDLAPALGPVDRAGLLLGAAPLFTLAQARRALVILDLPAPPPQEEPGLSDSAESFRPDEERESQTHAEQAVSQAREAIVRRIVRLERDAAGARWDAEPEAIDKGRLGPAAAPATPEAAPAPVVNVGFSAPVAPDDPLPGDMPLARDTEVLFWLEIGPPRQGALGAREPFPLDDFEEEAKLVVTLHAFPGELAPTPGEDVGKLVVRNRAVRVLEQPAGASPRSERLDVCLFFRVRTPHRHGEHRLRCNIYYEQNLIQSRVITARVMAQPERRAGALDSRLDFSITPRIRSSHLRGFSRQDLSLFFNDNGDRTHGLRVLGDQDSVLYKADASIPSDEIATLVREGREMLRFTTYSQTGEYLPGNDYRYRNPVPRKVFLDDLVRLARRGYRLYDELLSFLVSAAGSNPQETLERLLSGRRSVEISLKQSPALLLPAAMVYDLPLDPDLDRDESYSVCPIFQKALDDGTPLDDTPCFQARCPSMGEEPSVVCPSGFWGYRHSLGLPFTAGEDGEVQPIVPVPQGLKLEMNLSTDPGFVRRAKHVANLEALQPGWVQTTTRQETIAALRKQGWHVVYFYCHGGLRGEVPVLKVGPDPGSEAHNITSATLRSNRISWETPGPLVFINGCETTALEPKRAMNFVRAFMQTSHASGVIGTEVTNFEDLAAPFAEAFLGRFLGGIPAGEAVRQARVELLQQSNPTGLIYIPFVLNGLRLQL